MKKISTAIVAMFVIIAFGACTTEVPVKEVKKCAKIVDVKLFQRYLLGFFPNTFGPFAYKILDNGKRVEIDKTTYYKWGTANWLETAKEMEIRKNYCWTEYEKLK